MIEKRSEIEIHLIFNEDYPLQREANIMLRKALAAQPLSESLLHRLTLVRIVVVVAYCHRVTPPEAHNSPKSLTPGG